ncbi:hypothetical protein [Novosphingobium sp. P6W]|uniref:hypothetical protein n=1 Tax=Novosphingobium sp. P6W TaxID=1609758 RepID=UPI0006987B3C|nr:hypothetical protein [Novosphingobium sp. P6W]AXB76640.1 hypothetical protein TQ38_009185 [Novosphingobium sp. P6W]
MTPERLSRILTAYGSSPERWPGDEREAATRLLAQVPDAQARARGEQALDALLARHRVPAPHAALVGRTLAAFAPVSGLSVLRSWWARLALAGAAIAGIAAGVLTLDVQHGREANRQMLALSEDQDTIFASLDTGEVTP